MKKTEETGSTKKENAEAPRNKRLFFRRALILFCPALLFFSYFLVIVIRGGIHTSLLWIWPAAALILSALGAYIMLVGRFPLEHPACVISMILIIALLTSFAVCEGFIIGYMFSTAPDGVECIIVLGAAVNGEEPSVALYNRIISALEYLKNNPDTVAVLSGGKGEGENISEAECMRRILSENGISENRLIMEDKSTDTAENIKNTLSLIGDRYESIAIVTNNFHLYRAMRLMKKQTDIPCYGISAPFSTPLFVHFAVREYVGMCHDTLRGNV